VGSFGEFPREVDDQRPARNRESRDESKLAVDASRQSQGWAAVHTAHGAHTAHPDPRSNSCAACSRIHTLSSRPPMSGGLGRTPGGRKGPRFIDTSVTSVTRCPNLWRSNGLRRRRKTRLCDTAATRLRQGCDTAATRLRRDPISTCRLYRFSGSIRLSDGAVLFFDVGSESLTDDHALVAGRPRISAFGHGNRDDPVSLRATNMDPSPRVTPAQTSIRHLLAAFGRGAPAAGGLRFIPTTHVKMVHSSRDLIARKPLGG
jgi:hypothetical protein